jgi:hypothetical protein
MNCCECPIYPCPYGYEDEYPEIDGCVINYDEIVQVSGVKEK